MPRHNQTKDTPKKKQRTAQGTEGRTNKEAPHKQGTFNSKSATEKELRKANQAVGPKSQTAPARLKR